jgi:hypothetical protein
MHNKIPRMGYGYKKKYFHQASKENRMSERDAGKNSGEFFI